MINGTLDLEIFDMLDTIAKSHNVPAGQWAEYAGLKYSTRISELRAMVELQSKGNNPGKIGRAFTVGKCTALLNALKFILGEETVTKELLALLKKAKTEKERILLMALALPPDKEIPAKMYLESLLKAK